MELITGELESWLADVLGHDASAVSIVAREEKTGRRKIPVKVGIGNGTKIQILDGLKAGDKVILPT